MKSIEEILSKESLFKDKGVLSPHFIPDELPYRESHIERMIKSMAETLRGRRPKNLFIYGKTGTGKTCSLKHAIQRFEAYLKEKGISNIHVEYINARMMYNSRYRILNKTMKTFYPELEKSGFGLTYIYEKMVEFLSEGRYLIIAIDEIDVVKDLDDLVYTLSRVNDEVSRGGLSIMGISNKLSFKQNLDPRSRSSLFEDELIFPPYNASQVKEIIKQRIALGFREGVVKESAISLISAITAQENGDARYALKLLLKAGEIAEDEDSEVVEEKHVEKALELVEYDIAGEGIRTLPINQQLVLYALAKLSLNKSSKLTNEEGYFLSGEVYEAYSKIARSFGKRAKSARWYREYINELENLGLISTVYTSKGIRGHSRLIKIGISPEAVIRIVERNLGV